MRFLVVLLALVALPFLVLVHRHVYFLNDEPALLKQVMTVLQKEGLAGVRVKMDYLDVVLSGYVSGLPSREHAREVVDQLPGVRSRPQDNRIQVSPKLDGQWDGTELRLSGWLHDETTLKEVTAWLEAARPGLKVRYEEVQQSPYVSPEAAPKEGHVAALFQPLWSMIEKPASLKVLKTGATVQVTGDLPSEEFRDHVLNAITEGNANLEVTSDDLKAGGYVKEAGFLEPEATVQFLQSFYSSPEPGDFVADGKTIFISGNGTEAMRLEWDRLLSAMAPNTRHELNLTLYPSIYHLPGFRPASSLPEQVQVELKELLAECAVTFGPGYAAVAEQDQPKLQEAVQAIKAVGSDIQVVIGCYPDVTGDGRTNATMAQRRAEAVAEKLRAYGLSAANSEVVEFGPVPISSGIDFNRRVEIMLR